MNENAAKRCGETQPQIHQNEVFQMLFNEKLIQRRKERGLTQEELAGREVEVKPIVLPASELPKSCKKLRCLLAAAAACLLIGVTCFCLGRCAFPKSAPPEASHTAALPVELKTQSFSMSGRDARFTANADLDGKAFLYRSDFSELAPVELPTVYEDGVYTVANIPFGTYERMVLVLSADGQERSALVVEGLVISADGASWVNPD